MEHLPVFAFDKNQSAFTKKDKTDLLNYFYKEKLMKYHLLLQSKF